MFTFTHCLIQQCLTAHVVWLMYFQKIHNYCTWLKLAQSITTSPMIINHLKMYISKTQPYIWKHNFLFYKKKYDNNNTESGEERNIFFVTCKIIQSITSSEICALHLTHPSAHTPGAMGSQRCSAWGRPNKLKKSPNVWCLQTSSHIFRKWHKLQHSFGKLKYCGIWHKS